MAAIVVTTPGPVVVMETTQTVATVNVRTGVDGATGATGPTGPAPAGYLAGSGSPVGVVTAAVGDLYRDSAITNGAALWSKTSGAGTSTGWTVLQGDTGWRELTPTADWVKPSGIGTYALRRINSQVLFKCYVGPSPALVSSGAMRAAYRPNFLTQLAAGFRNTDATYGLMGTAVSTISPSFFGSFMRLADAHQLDYYPSQGIGGAYVAADRITGTAEWSTFEAWPVGALPGTAGTY